ncbi:hypothetical protein [Clostridium peptidivorans]|uniref:hypothetical protein n=1 Tax=Clostridium peptidivorans TaxID=100174 RepID=UPI000BE4541E|nr:hypothetical protein [Clostridium peptidivorans]
MAKKISIIFMLLLFISTNVYAGDIPESIMEGKQKALFIGKITATNNNIYSVVPSTVMMGSIQQSEVQIKKIDKYYGTNNKPKVGDFIVAVLLDENKIDDTWIFKSTSDDYKTLKLVSESYDMVVRYEKYINEGKYFEAQKRIDEDNKVSITSTNVSVDSTATVQNNKEQSYLTNKKLIPLLTIVASGIICFFIIRFKKSHIN